MTNQNRSLTPWEIAELRAKSEASQRQNAENNKRALQYQMAQQGNSNSLLGLALGKLLRQQFDDWNHERLLKRRETPPDSTQSSSNSPNYNFSNWNTDDPFNLRNGAKLQNGLLGDSSGQQIDNGRYSFTVPELTKSVQKTPWEELEERFAAMRGF